MAKLASARARPRARIFVMTSISGRVLEHQKCRLLSDHFGYRIEMCVFFVAGKIGFRFLDLSEFEDWFGVVFEVDDFDGRVADCVVKRGTVRSVNRCNLLYMIRDQIRFLYHLKNICPILFLHGGYVSENIEIFFSRFFFLRIFEMIIFFTDF